MRRGNFCEMQQQPLKYSSGQVAIDFHDDGSGYIYYPNGRVAVAVSTASDYQNSFYAFDKNRRGTILLGIDEYGCGFASSTSRKSAAIELKTLVLSTSGCIAAEEGKIVHEWLWDRKAMNCGVEPSGNIVTVLNEHLTFVSKNCKILSLEFNCDGICRTMDLGAKERRTDNYLEHCTRLPGGRLIPNIDYTTLKQRQISFNESMKAQRNKVKTVEIVLQIICHKISPHSGLNFCVQLHPKSENLSEMVRDIVSKLEINFEDISRRMETTPGPGTTWKSIALASTLGEIPRIPIAGTETGAIPGFGTHIYAMPATIDFSKTVGKVQNYRKKEKRKNNTPVHICKCRIVCSHSNIAVNFVFGQLPSKLVDDKGRWKGEVEVRSTLREMNPPLARSAILKANSGRYSLALVVDKTAVTADNPTGMVVPVGLPLASVYWRHFKAEIGAMVSNPSAPLTVILLLRNGDARGHAFERVAEIANLMADNERSSCMKSAASTRRATSAPASGEGAGSSGMKSGGVGSSGAAEELKYVVDKASTAGLRMLRMDVCENNEIVSELGVKSLPTFLFFKGPNLAYAGPVGGKKVKLTISSKPQILIIEPDFKMQVQIEKSLRKNGYDTFLCLTVAEAMDRIHQFSGIGDTASIVFDVVLVAEDVSSMDLSVLAQRLAENVKSRRTVIAALVSVLGPRGKHNLEAVSWHHHFSNEVSTLLPVPLSNIAQAVIQKPVKPISVEKLLSMRHVPPEDLNFGLTPETLLNKVKKVYDDLLGKSAPMMSHFTATGAAALASTQSSQYVGIRLSAEDVRMRGKSLTR